MHLARYHSHAIHTYFSLGLGCAGRGEGMRTLGNGARPLIDDDGVRDEMEWSVEEWSAERDGVLDGTKCGTGSTD